VAARVSARPPDDVLTRFVTRRGFLLTAISLGGLTASYGLFMLFALRFLYPRKPQTRKAKMFVGFTHDIPPRTSVPFQTPEGESFLLTNTGTGLTPFQAFSSRCPHLGCQVHWNGDQQHFDCPCHGGIFNANGVATAGPPAQAGQSLKACEVIVEGASVYAMVDRA
jgi:Rieske Fe-S protein